LKRWPVAGDDPTEPACIIGDVSKATRQRRRPVPPGYGIGLGAGVVPRGSPRCCQTDYELRATKHFHDTRSTRTRHQMPRGAGRPTFAACRYCQNWQGQCTDERHVTSSKVWAHDNDVISAGSWAGHATQRAAPSDLTNRGSTLRHDVSPRITNPPHQMNFTTPPFTVARGRRRGCRRPSLKRVTEPELPDRRRPTRLVELLPRPEPRCCDFRALVRGTNQR